MSSASIQSVSIQTNSASSPVTLTPDIDGNYFLDICANDTTFSVNIVANAGASSVEIINQITSASWSSASSSLSQSNIPLTSAGSGYFGISVISQDGTNTISSSLSISNTADTTLIDVAVDGNALTFPYSYAAPLGTTNVAIDFATLNPNATVVITDASENGSSPPGSNNFLISSSYTITVTAENGITTATYPITITDSSTTTTTTTTAAPGVVCFLGNAPVSTPGGPRRIDSLHEGDLVLTPEGEAVAIKRVKAMRVRPGPSTNPYVIAAGQFGATEELLISPRHRVATAGGAMVEARALGLVQKAMRAPFNYYNIELPGWANMRVAGVEVESLAPAKRVVATADQFRAAIAKLPKTAETAKLLRRVCQKTQDGKVVIFG